MRKMLPATLITALFLCSLSTLPSSVQAATQISGVIKSDTTWRSIGSPYQLTAPTDIANGVTLTIEPGVTVDLGMYYLQVDGALYAQGTSNNKIYVTGASGSQIQFKDSSVDWSDTTGRGCVLENADVNRVTLLVEGCAPRIANNVIHNTASTAVSALNGSPSIVGNTFKDIFNLVIEVGGTSVVKNNVFTTTQLASAIKATQNAYISNNQINGFCKGITVNDGQVIVKDNVISNCSDGGIWQLWGNPQVQGNYLVANHIGIRVGGTCNVESNTIINNEVGIQVESTNQLTIKNNNFVDNTKNSITLAVPNNVDASNNWWGTTDKQTIDQAINDNKDNFNLGTVNYEPMLSQPSSSAPTNSLIDSLGSGNGNNFFFLPIATQADILFIAELVVAAIVVAWAVVIAFFVSKRRRKKTK